MAETVTDLDAIFTRLTREPDFDARELQAYDATDSLLLQTAGDELRTLGPGELVVIADRHGALTIGAAAAYGISGIRVHQDPVLAERALVQNAERLGVSASFTFHSLDERLLKGARVVLLQLPRGLDALREIAWAIARFADPGVRVFAGGRVKHMTRTQNEVLGTYFADVSAGLGWRKSRVLTARSPLNAGSPPFPQWGDDRDLKFSVAAHGATFGGATLDHGSRLMLTTLRDAAPTNIRNIVDLGCGNGVLAVAVAQAIPDARVIATDQSAAAVASTTFTAKAADVDQRIEVHRADGTEAVPDGWADLILLNPPFHTGATVHAGVAHRLIRSCARALAPGGELRLVFNSHLAYRPVVERAIGDTRQLARDRTFTVLSAIRD